ncbi:MAG: hypothetical protein NT162_02205 [Candidatus Woesebacteria bacterium]|nr:hypothetical protein [Candidatus Woesebacteria bacterium]
MNAYPAKIKLKRAKIQAPTIKIQTAYCIKVPIAVPGSPLYFSKPAGGAIVPNGLSAKSVCILKD